MGFAIESIIPPMQILLADDHELLRGGLHQIIDAMDKHITVREAGSLQEVFESITKWPDMALLLLDLSMPGMNGVHSIARIRRIAPAVPIIVISANEEVQIIQAAMQAGAAGYIPKSSSCSVIQDAIQLVLDGGIYLPPQSITFAQLQDEKRGTLTPRQTEVLFLIAQGLSNKGIARELDVAEGTIKQHAHAIFEQLDLSSRSQAVLKARDMGLI